MSGHGPDAATYRKASKADTTRPRTSGDTMAFMFETRCLICPTPIALGLPQLDAAYAQCWQTLPSQFTGRSGGA
jgi:homogentisate 1,2-dioxygenase